MMKIHTLSFPTFGLTRSVREFVYPQRRVVSYLLTRFPCSSNQNCSFLSISVLMLNGRVQVLLRVCSSTICSQIDHMYIYRKTWIMHAVLWCCECCECNKDEYDEKKFRVVMYEPLLWKYGTKSSPEAVQRSHLLLKYSAELPSGLRFSRSLPQICAEVSGAPQFD